MNFYAPLFGSLIYHLSELMSIAATPKRRLPLSLIVLAISTLALAALPAAAQPMVDQVPSDAIIYLGWTSGQGLSEGYANSHLKKLIDASNLRQTINEFFPAIVRKVGVLDAGDQTAATQVTQILILLIRHPAAIYFEGFDLGDPAHPLPKIGLVCDADHDAAALEKDLSAFGRIFSSPNFQVHRADGRVTMQVARPTTQPASRAAQNIRFHKAFAEALAQVDSDPTVLLYIDTPRLLASVDDALKHNANVQSRSIWTKVVSLLGLEGVHQAIWTGDFEGPNWDRRAFMGTSGPPRGLIALLAGRSLTSDDVLKAVPQTASMVAAYGFDASAAFEQLRTALAGIDPGLSAQLDHMVAHIQAESGVDLKKDFLAALGSDWAEYLDPNVGGSNLMDTVYINELHDPAKAQESLNKLETWLNGWLEGQLAGSKVHVRFKQATLQGVTVHYLAIPVVTPAWAIADGRLYFSLYPEITAAAVRAASGKSSILDNVSFSAMRTRLIPASGQAITSAIYADLSQFAPCTYGSWLTLTRMSGLADLFGIDSPLQIMPPLASIMNELSPAASISWSDNAGLHWRSLSPFPGCRLLMVDPTSMYQQTGPLLASIVVPSLNRAREMARRVQSASKLRQMGVSIYLYAQDHNDQLPDTLGQLLPYFHNDVKVYFKLNAPPVPQDVRGDEKALARWVDARSDYAYVGGGKRLQDLSRDKNLILAYEKHRQYDEGANALFADGHVEWLSLPQLKRLLRDVKGQTPAATTRTSGAAAPQPPLTQAQQLDHHVKMRQAADSLRQIEQALRKYAKDNKAVLPKAPTRPTTTTKPN